MNDLTDRKFGGLTVIHRSKGGAPKTHGATYTKLYRRWGYIKERCNNPKHSNYKYYGNRGISVCETWKNSFILFKHWALANGYENNLTIDRINHHDNYNPSNCQWLTKPENTIKGNLERRK
jgi:hypothetical protein